MRYDALMEGATHILLVKWMESDVSFVQNNESAALLLDRAADLGIAATERAGKRIRHRAEDTIFFVTFGLFNHVSFVDSPTVCRQALGRKIS